MIFAAFAITQNLNVVPASIQNAQLVRNVMTQVGYMAVRTGQSLSLRNTEHHIIARSAIVINNPL